MYNYTMYTCPRCRAKQKFGLQRQYLPDDTSKLFIKCTKCRWQRVVLVQSNDIIDIHRDIKRLQVRAKNYPGLKTTLDNRIKRFYESLDK